ncbi:MAG: hypothetical protein LCH84_00365 [Gemmatimonadetes bacterium]|nr:hypothetical protein [Gemmatimonadota bacterium]
MSRFFPRDVIHWGEERLHPLRAFAIRTVEPAGITGVALRLWRAVVFVPGQWWLTLSGVLVGVLFLCGMLTWHLGHFPVRRWPLRALAFLVIEIAAEMGTSTLLIALGRERVGSRPAVWPDWWPMAWQTLWQRTLLVAVFALLLAAVVQVVRRTLDRRASEALHRQLR